MRRTYQFAQEAAASGALQAGADAAGSGEKMVPPEIRLVQSKSDIESPAVSIRAERIVLSADGTCEAAPREEGSAAGGEGGEPAAKKRKPARL